MGHLLATVNPGAADQIGGEPATGPDISTMVVYIARPGEGRRGRMEFPAMVMHSEEGGALELLVIYDANDVIERIGIPQQTEEHQFPAWRYARGASPQTFNPGRLQEIEERLNGFNQNISLVNEQVFGEYEAPAGGIMSFLVKFEKQLKDFGSKLKAPKGK